jgi:hypothetical protein
MLPRSRGRLGSRTYYFAEATTNLSIHELFDGVVYNFIVYQFIKPAPQ